MRIHQWSKNLLIIVPLVMSHKVSDLNLLARCLYTVFTFSILTSIVYIINDFRDLESDKLQDYKKSRPLASGELSRNFVAKLVAVLIIVEVLLLINVDFDSIQLFIVYLLLNVAYTFYLKQREILDVICLTAFYLLRIFIGGVTANVKISFWLLSFSCFLFFSLSALKRVAELQMSKEGAQKSNSRGYQIDDSTFLSIAGITTGFTSVSLLGLYINDDSVVSLYSEPEALWLTIPVVMHMISKLWLDTFRGKMYYDPIAYLFRNRELILMLMLLPLILGFASR